MESDGVIKYSLQHRTAALEEAMTDVCTTSEVGNILEHVRKLDEIRTELHDLNLIGVSPEGVGFGNLSLYLGNGAFIISGSGTGKARTLGSEGYCVVQKTRPEKNEVCSLGPVQPSSEAMTHAAVYAALSEISFPIRCVVHVHNSGLFSHYLPIAPKTPVSAAYGTPALAHAVRQLIPTLHTGNGFFVLAGHQDGLVFFGDTPEHTLKTIRSALREADISVLYNRS